MNHQVLSGFAKHCKVLYLFVAPKDREISDYVKPMSLINDKVYVCFFDKLKFLKLGAEHISFRSTKFNFHQQSV